MSSTDPAPDDAWDSQLLRRLSGGHRPEGAAPPSAARQPDPPSQAAQPARVPRAKLPSAPPPAVQQRPAPAAPAPAAPPAPASPTAPTGPRRPSASREPLGDLDRTLARRPAVSRTRRLIRRATGVFGSDDTPDRLAAAAERVQLAIPTGRRIVVLGAHGGAGSSTAAAAVALHLAHHRADRTALFSALPDRGALAARLGQREWATTGSAAAGLSWTHQSLDNISLPPTPEPRLLAVAEGSSQPADVLALIDAAGRTRAFTVVDAGLRAAPDLLDRAHVVLVALTPSLEGVSSARRCLQDLRAAGSGADRLRLLVVDTGRDTGLSASRALSLLADLETPTDILPADRHLAVGAPIDPSLVAEATKVAVAELAAGLVEQAARVV